MNIKADLLDRNPGRNHHVNTQAPAALPFWRDCGCLFAPACGLIHGDRDFLYEIPMNSGPAFWQFRQFVNTKNVYIFELKIVDILEARDYDNAIGDPSTPYLNVRLHYFPGGRPGIGSSPGCPGRWETAEQD